MYIHVHMYMATVKYKHVLMRARVNIYVYVIDTRGQEADSCKRALTWRFVVVRLRKGGYTGGASQIHSNRARAILWGVAHRRPKTDRTLINLLKEMAFF